MVYLQSKDEEDLGVLMYDKVLPRQGDYIEKEGRTMKVLSLTFNDDNGRITITVKPTDANETSSNDLPLEGKDKEEFDSYLKNGHILGAVKLLKDKTGYGLRECRDITMEYRSEILNIR